MYHEHGFLSADNKLFNKDTWLPDSGA